MVTSQFSNCFAFFERSCQLWFSTSVFVLFRRVEDCFLSTISSYAYRFRTATVYQQPAPETHLSYDFFLSVASSISLVDKVFIHSMTQTFESRYLSPILDAKKEQLFSSTSWSQSRMFSDCVVRDARQKPKSRAADQEEDDFTWTSSWGLIRFAIVHWVDFT